jgi:hypothetical protein
LADAQTTHWVFEKLLGWDMSLADAMMAQGGPMGLMPASPRESLLPLELEEALERRKPVMMEYLDASQHRTQRLIEPLHIRRVSGELMLVAHCRLREAQRTFKVERIVQLTRIEDVPVEQAAALNEIPPCEPIPSDPPPLPNSELSPSPALLDNPPPSP